jgi:hypothetical protein
MFFIGAFSLIHLVTRKFSPCIHVAQLTHQVAIFLRSPLPACKSTQSSTEKLMQRCFLTLRLFSGKFDVGFGGLRT